MSDIHSQFQSALHTIISSYVEALVTEAQADVMARVGAALAPEPAPSKIDTRTPDGGTRELLAALKAAPKGLAISEIKKVLDDDRGKIVKERIAVMTSAGLIRRTGRNRGTRYHAGPKA